MNNNMNLRSMIETALLSAIATVIILLTNIPFLAFLFIVAAVPMTVLTARRGVYAGIAGSVITGMILFMTSGPIIALSNAGICCLAGVGAGYMIKKEWTSSKTIFVSSLFFTLGISLTIYLGFVLNGINPSDVMSQAFQQATDMMQQRGTELKLSQEDINIQLDMIKAMNSLVQKTLPAIVLSMGMILSILNYFISRPILTRTGSVVVKMHKFRDFKLPSSLLPGILLIVVLTFGADYIGYIDSDIILINLVVIFSYVFAFQGAATLAFLTTERGGNVEKRAVMVVFATILFVMVFGLQVLSLLGLMDATIDIRKLYQNRKG